MNTPVEHEPRWTGLREVMRMSGPIVLGSLSFTLMEFTDMVMVAALGTDALAAAGSAGVWSFTAGCFIFGTVGCVSTFAAQCYGRGEFSNCARYAWQGLYLSLLVIVMAVALWPAARPLFGSMGHTPAVTQLEIAYFQVRLIGYLGMTWMSVLASFFQAVNHPRVPMRIAIQCNVLNIALNYVFIFGKLGMPAMGVAGAAMATVISQYAQVVALLGVFLSAPMHARFSSRTTWRVDFVRIRELFRIGLPSGLTLFMDVANWGIFTSYVVGRFGAVQLASHNAAIQFMHLSFMPALGLNQGITAIVGQHIGRSDIPRVKARTYTALRIGIGYMVSVGLCFAFFGPHLLRTFFSADDDVVRLGHILLIMAAIFQGFDAINIVSSGALRGAGDTRWMAYMTFIGAYLVFLPLAMLLAYVVGWGTVGAWLGATVYVMGLSGVLFSRFRGERWRSIRIFSSEASGVSG
ncbi:MAG TPA: MATE family efflux transporter [Candidatus Hydrogenedentes bacterium]|nr:MATE family efflux transporter [Candidatus Hydrogenedentota bacterium]HPG67053.1 MATE family efflux transporter [Candidatus Hydrogenedentota bacterium]